MTSRSCTPPTAIFKIPIEIWLRIALFADLEAACVGSERKTSLAVPLIDSASLRYNIPSSNLTPGSAPLTPLGPVSGSASDIESQERTLSIDYFSARTVSSREEFRDERGYSGNPVSQVIVNIRSSSDHTVELLASGTAASGAETPSISLGVSTLRDDGVANPKINPRLDTSRDAIERSRQPLSALSRTCHHLRCLIWPYVTGSLRVPLAALQSRSFDICTDLTDRITLLQSHVRDLEVSITPADDFRAIELLRLLEHVGQSLDTLLLRFQPSSNGVPTGVPAHYQLSQMTEGMFLPSRLGAFGTRATLLPKLARLRILSRGDATGRTVAGNLPSLLAHSSGLVELDLSGAPMDLRMFMTTAEQLIPHGKSLEVLHLNLHQPRLSSLGSRGIPNNRFISIALNWLLDHCGTFRHLRSFSMTSFGGVEIVTDSLWISIAQRIRASFPLLQGLSLPVAPLSSGTADIASQCAEAVALLISDSPWHHKHVEPLGSTSALADLQTVMLKLTCEVERVADMRSDMEAAKELHSGRPAWQDLPLTEFGEAWHGSIVRDSQGTARPKAVGRSMPFRNP